MSEKTEELKLEATKQVARTGEKAIDLLEGAGRFFDQVLGQGLRHIGGSFSDWASVFRYENSLKLADKIDAIHAQRAIPNGTKVIDPRLAIPLIQAATAENDDDLQSMWAGLIANATDPGRSTKARRDFVTLLSNLEPIDVHCLNAIHMDMKVNGHKKVVAGAGDPKGENERDKRNVEWLCNLLSAKPEEVRISVESIERLGLVVDRGEDPDDDLAGQIIVPVTHKEADLWLSYTGEALLEACSS